MSANIADLTLRTLERAETAARSGAYNLNDRIQVLKGNRDIRVIEQSIRWCADENEQVRNLGMELLEPRRLFSETELNCLRILMRDENSEVRNSATFYLGVQCDIDEPSIREALYERAFDNHDETRGEALVGLAIRKDARAFQLIEAELKTGNVGMLAVEAAAELADPRLLPALMALKGWWDVDKDLLARAISDCKEAI